MLTRQDVRDCVEHESLLVHCNALIDNTAHVFETRYCLMGVHSGALNAGLHTGRCGIFSDAVITNFLLCLILKER